MSPATISNATAGLGHTRKTWQQNQFPQDDLVAHIHTNTHTWYNNYQSNTSQCAAVTFSCDITAYPTAIVIGKSIRQQNRRARNKCKDNRHIKDWGICLIANTAIISIKSAVRVKFHNVYQIVCNDWWQTMIAGCFVCRRPTLFCRKNKIVIEGITNLDIAREKYSEHCWNSEENSQ